MSTRAEAGTLSVSPWEARLAGAAPEAVPDPHAASKIVTRTAGSSEKLRACLGSRPITIVRRSMRGGRCIGFPRTATAARPEPTAADAPEPATPTTRAPTARTTPATPPTTTHHRRPRRQRRPRFVPGFRCYNDGNREQTTP